MCVNDRRRHPRVRYCHFRFVVVIWYMRALVYFRPGHVIVVLEAVSEIVFALCVNLGRIVVDIFSGSLELFCGEFGDVVEVGRVLS